MHSPDRAVALLAGSRPRSLRRPAGDRPERPRAGQVDQRARRQRRPRPGGGGRQRGHLVLRGDQFGGARSGERRGHRRPGRGCDLPRDHPRCGRVDDLHGQRSGGRRPVRESRHGKRLGGGRRRDLGFRSQPLLRPGFGRGVDREIDQRPGCRSAAGPCGRGRCGGQLDLRRHQRRDAATDQRCGERRPGGGRDLSADHSGSWRVDDLHRSGGRAGGAVHQHRHRPGRAAGRGDRRRERREPLFRPVADRGLRRRARPDLPDHDRLARSRPCPRLGSLPRGLRRCRSRRSADRRGLRR